MQKLFFLVVFLFLGITTEAQEHFYYYKGEKVYLELDLKRVSMNTSDRSTDFKIDKVKFSDVSQDYTTNSLNNLKNSTGESAQEPLYYYEIEFLEDRSLPEYLDFIKQYNQWEGVVNAFPTYKTKEGGVLGVSNIFYVKLREVKDLDVLKEIANKAGVQIVGNNIYMPLYYALQLPEQSRKNTLEWANYFQETHLFESAEPAFIYHNLQLTNDPLYPKQWGVKNTGQYGGIPGIDINVEDAWAITKGANAKVAIFDHGFEMNHPDLQPNVYGVGYDATTATSPSQVRGSHGTPCAGIIGAVQNNNIGISGVAPEASLISISINLLFSDTPMMLANGFSWAWQNGIDVISNSWGGYAPSNIITDAISDALTLGRQGKGCIVVFAAGNENNTNVRYPGNYFPEILVVGAMSPCGERKSPTSCEQETWWGSCYGPTLDVVAPGVKIATTDRQGQNGYGPGDYIEHFNGTSSACPFVAGVAALVVSANPNLTGKEVRDIIESTTRKVRTDLYQYNTVVDRANGSWNFEMGYGLVDAKSAVIKAIKENQTLDLFIRNSPKDIGNEPDINTTSVFYRSPDIWVRNKDDGGLRHQNPVYNPTQYSYIYVRVKNRSTVASTVKDSVRLHWAKAATSLMWPDYWNGTIKHNNIPLGGVLATQQIPILQPGAETIVKFEWKVPNPSDFVGITNQPWHFCLLARIISNEDRMTTPEQFYLEDNVRNNNNIAWKNLTVIGLFNKKKDSGAFIVENPLQKIEAFDLRLFSNEQIKDSELLKTVDITVQLSPSLYNAWVLGGSKSNGIKAGNQKNTVQLLNNGARLNNIILKPFERGVVNMNFELMNNNPLKMGQNVLHVDQVLNTNQKLIGGTSFVVRKPQKSQFVSADAGPDHLADIGDIITLNAKDVGEPATYNWYDSTGNLVHEGLSFTVNVIENTTWTLEVITDDEGNADYDEVSVNLKNSLLKEIFPNPAKTSLQVNYQINKRKSAKLEFVPIYGAVGNAISVPLHVSESSVVVDVSHWQRGLYKLVLYCDGEMMEVKNVLID